MKPDKVAIITGASQGIGLELLRAYRGLGYAVVANSRSIEPSSDEYVHAVPGDIADPLVAVRLAETALANYGRIDTLVNNAGVSIVKPFTEYTIDDFTRASGVTLGGFFHLTQQVIPPMLAQGSGHIVSITTTLIESPTSRVTVALASLTRGGVHAATRALALEYAHQGIRVNAVSPGVIDTPMHLASDHEFLASLHPMGRIGSVSDIAAGVLYLEQASFVTGETLHIDGGQVAGY